MDNVIDFQKKKEQMKTALDLKNDDDRKDELLLKAVINGLSESEGQEFADLYKRYQSSIFRMMTIAQDSTEIIADMGEDVSKKHTEQVNELVSMIEGLLE